MNWEAILTPHFEAALTRISQHPVVLCLQDTTALNFNGRETESAGPFTYDTQTGMYLHPTLSITPDREVLGVLDAWMWSREYKDEIKCTYMMSKEKPPTQAPKLNEVIRKIAMLGGFLGRKSDGEPGSESIWIGLSRVRDSVFTLEPIREFGI